MTRRTSSKSESLEVYPNLRTAARILNVAASTLSRRDDLAAEKRGDRDVVIPAMEVLRLGTIYRRRALNDVAQAVLEHAHRAAPGEASRVEEEIEGFFESRSLGDTEKAEFLDMARRLLPEALFEDIERAMEEQADELPDMIQGWHPTPES